MRVLTEEVVCVLIVGMGKHVAVEEVGLSHITVPAKTTKQYFKMRCLCGPRSHLALWKRTNNLCWRNVRSRTQKVLRVIRRRLTVVS